MISSIMYPNTQAEYELLEEVLFWIAALMSIPNLILTSWVTLSEHFCFSESLFLIYEIINFVGLDDIQCYFEL